jgi:ABC-type multidrug transport system ATPase subunit
MSANTHNNETAPYELLGAHDLRVDLGGTTILKDVSLSIGPGERVAIVGPNGAGKTTLMRALSGAVPATSGEVILCTEPIQNSRNHFGLGVIVHHNENGHAHPDMR